MEYEKNKTAPVETDFYTEALKAFDAPIPQPKAPEPTEEVTEPAPQEKPRRRFNPWWAVGLCALLCLALVVGFGRGFGNTSRGENYIYGIVLECGDGYATVVTGNEKWYAELEGMKAPTGAPGDLAIDPPTQPIWVFYNGEPEETDQNGCTKKITATFWKTDPGLYLSRDEIEFDLDGDGRKEVWSVSYERGFTALYASSFAYRVSLTAKDAQGNTLHSVYFESTEAMSMAFSDVGGKLSLVLYCNGTYKELDIRLKDGELTVYNGAEDQPLYPQITGPLMTDPEVPTLGAEQDYALLFWLEAGAMTERIELSAGEARTLQMQLDALQWSDSGETGYKFNWCFQFYEGQEFKTYKFAKGVLLCDGKEAKIGRELTEKLMDLMGREMPPEQAYYAYISNGEFIQITFYDSGMVRVQVSDSNGNVSRSYIGRYSSIGDLYLMDLGEEMRHVMALKRSIYGMEYLTSGSSQTMFRENEGLRFRTDSGGGTVEFSLRDSSGVWIMGSENAVIPVQSAYQLRQKLYDCDWQDDAAYAVYEILGFFTIYDGVGTERENPEQYYLLTGCRLLRPATEPGQKEAIATVEEKALWTLLSSYFSQQGEHTDATYMGRNQDGTEMRLQLMKDGSYQVRAQLKYDNGDTHTASFNGLYVRMGSCLALLTWDKWPCYIHLNIRDGQLVYDAERSKADMAFSQTTEVTLSDLQMDAYRFADVSFDLYDDAAGGNFSYRDEHVELSDEMAIAISQLLSTLQWNQLQAAPSGVAMGSFSFADAASIPESIEVYSGMRLVYRVYGGSYEAQLNEDQWATVCALMISTGDVVDASQYARLGDVTYSLLLNGRYQFLLGIGSQDYNEQIFGVCSVLRNEVLVCYGDNGDVFALRMEEAGWRLMPGYNGIEAFAVPDGTILEDPIVDILPEEEAVPA